MYVNKDDKNTLLMILGILVVSLVALIAIFNIVFQIIRPGVEKVLNDVSKVVKVNTLDYNFKVPPKAAVQAAQTIVEPKPVEEIPISLPVTNYNFTIPEETKPTVVKGNPRFYESINSDLTYRIFTEANKAFDSDKYTISIPKISIESRIFEGEDAESFLKRGFWVNPVSNKFGKGGVILMCYRRYFDSNDPRSCYYLNNLAIGDEIYIEKEGQKVKYKVKGINEFKEPVDHIYDYLTNDDYIKIVTSSPTDLGTKRLVIMAYRE